MKGLFTRQTLRRATCVVAVICASICGLCCTGCIESISRSLIYMPPKPIHPELYPAVYGEWEQHRRTFKRPNAELSGWFIERKGQPLMVYYAGNAMDVGNMLFLSKKYPYAMLFVNYRSYGLSTGEPTEENLVNDSIAVLDQVLKESGRSPQDVILVGQSLGTGVAVQVAAARDVKKLVLLVPFASLVATAKHLVPALPSESMVPDHYRSDLFAPKVKAPVSILAALADEICPIAQARYLKDCFKTQVDYHEFPSFHNSIFTAKDFWEIFSKSIGAPVPEW